MVLRHLPRIPATVIALLVMPTLATPPTITEADLSVVSIKALKLSMDLPQVEQILQAQFGATQPADSQTTAAFKCNKAQCQAQSFSAEEQMQLTLHFNRAGLVNWITLETQVQLAGSPAECLNVAATQLAGLRQQYSPADNRHFYGQHSVTLRLNKPGHPDPADNSRFGFRVQIKCDPFAKGVATTEYELVDMSL